MTASGLSTNGLLARANVPFTKTLAALASTLYLTHKAIGHAVMLAFPRITTPREPASWLLYACACLGAAGLLHLAVEIPFLRLRDRATAILDTRAFERKSLKEPAL